MVSIYWCLKTKKGLELVESSENMSSSYLKMAEESLRMIQKNKESRIWLASISYYTMYYSLYAIMMKIGVKCEIHNCSLEFMKQFLPNFYSKNDCELIHTAFELRNDLQYYPDRLVDDSILLKISQKAPDFFVKSRKILYSISESEINLIREKLSKLRK